MPNDAEVDPAMIAKIVDLPPYGPRNADPLTDEAGAHPIEVGVGAAVAGAVGGMAAGVVAGPVGVILGAIGGAIVGGAAGKGVGEVIDATTDIPCDASELKRPDGVDAATEQRAFRFGAAARLTFPDRQFPDVESDLQPKWAAAGETAKWAAVRDIVRLAFDRGA